MICMRIGTACWAGSLVVTLLGACAKSDDVDDPSSGGSGGFAGTSGSGGGEEDAGEIPIDPLCEQFCAKANTTCQGCDETGARICSESLLDEKCGAQNRAVAECYVSDAATVTCEDGELQVAGCEAQIREVQKCEFPEDSCESALNGECNEPDPCAPGTDSTDCAPQ
jgi:hypothetical protein